MKNNKMSCWRFLHLRSLRLSLRALHQRGRQATANRCKLTHVECVMRWGMPEAMQAKLRDCLKVEDVIQVLDAITVNAR